MADKQIIIDGVDVSGCPYYIDSDGSCSSHDCECVKCVHNVCLYKDYKAKEQECEVLKETLKTKAKGWANVNDKILEEVKQIRVENEKLKTALKFRDSSIDAKNKVLYKR